MLIAAGFVGPELGRARTRRRPDSDLARHARGGRPDWRLDGLEGAAPVFACGDAVRGQSLIVWAIAEGRSAAAGD